MRKNLCQPFDMIRYGVPVDIYPRLHGKTQPIQIEETVLPFECDHKKITAQEPKICQHMN